MDFIDADRVHARCGYDVLVPALERYHLEDTEVMKDLLVSQPSDGGLENHLFVRAAWQRQRAMGIKLVSIFPENPTREAGLPAIQAVYVLFEGESGTPIATIDGTALTYRKTAADSALGSKYLSRPDVATMLMVGAGAMAPHLIAAHLAVRPSIERVQVWNRTRSRAERLVRQLAPGSASIEVAKDLESAARGADVISCATMTETPIIDGRWLTPGTHLDLVGAFTPAMREADDRALRCASIFVDSRLTTLEHVGELMIPLAAGVISKADVLADLYDFAHGRHPGRRDPQEITLFKNGGGAHLDLMTARFIVAPRSDPGLGGAPRRASMASTERMIEGFPADPPEGGGP